MQTRICVFRWRGGRQTLCLTAGTLCVRRIYITDFVGAVFSLIYSTLPLWRYVFCLPRKVTKRCPQGNLRFPYETFPLLAYFSFLGHKSQRAHPSPTWLLQYKHASGARLSFCRIESNDATTNFSYKKYSFVLYFNFQLHETTNQELQKLTHTIFL